MLTFVKQGNRIFGEKIDKPAQSLVRGRGTFSCINGGLTKLTSFCKNRDSLLLTSTAYIHKNCVSLVNVNSKWYNVTILYCAWTHRHCNAQSHNEDDCLQNDFEYICVLTS